MLIRDLFVSDVTRDIPPVVYFHEQTPKKLADEVAEYIITGGWPEDHPNHRRVPNGIHEQYVCLLRAITAELGKPGGPELPTSWISGFYGSGKSSFAKLLGLALDGVALPSGTSLIESLLARDTSPRAADLRKAWQALRQKIDPIAVVYDIGGFGRDNEHIHSATVRQVQKRLGYCTQDPLVADFELKLEREGEWPRFQEVAREVLGKPWDEVKDKPMAEEDFSLVMSQLRPEHYSDPMSWYTSRAGTHARSESPEEAVAAIRDMLRLRSPSSTLFIVVDEVSQYVLANKDRVDRMRAFATALGSTLKGKAWLLALGQQKLDEQADDSFLVWAKDRFPPKLRVHLAATNIRDVVHKRLLQKKPEMQDELRGLFDKHRADLKLFAYGCEAVTPEEFVEVYPMLPGHIDLLLQITSALRTRSARAQGDDQAIRGLLQLLGELFRSQGLADMPVGSLVTLDQIYEVQYTALDSDVQASMARILDRCADDDSELLPRVAKAVALLELIQETVPTDAKLVAQCLFDRLDRGNLLEPVTEALEELRRRNLLGKSERHGYKIQSSAAEEWERDRRDISVGRETISDTVRESLKYLLASPERPKHQGRPFPWAGLFSDGRRLKDAILEDPRDAAAVTVDFRFLVKEERTESTWIKRSAEEALENRLVWVSGDTEQLDHNVRELNRSRAMVRKYEPRKVSLSPPRKLLLQQEKNRVEDMEGTVRDSVAGAWMAGKLYFRGRAINPTDQGATFPLCVNAVASRVLPDLFPHLVATAISPAELAQLIEAELSGPSPKFLTGELGILELDGGRYVPACSGVVPRRVLEYIDAEGGISGTTLLARFGAPPYGYTANVVKACAAGLLRGDKVRIQPEGGAEITAIRDAGVRELFDKDRPFRRATVFPAGEPPIGPQDRARIRKFFERFLSHSMDGELTQIADAVAHHFTTESQRLRDVLTRLSRLPGTPEAPAALTTLSDVLEQCVRSCRQTEPTVKLVKRHLDKLRDGFELLKLYNAELTDEAIAAVRDAAQVRIYQAAQLEEIGSVEPEIEAAIERVDNHLSTERPWRDVAALDEELQKILDAYRSERSLLLQRQEQQAEQARGRVKAREGFSTLSADDSHKVLRPLAVALTNTTDEAVAPPLSALVDPFTVALRRAEDDSNERLDEILSAADQPMVQKVDLSLRNREIKDEADVEALVDEIRKRLLKVIKTNARVRLV
jgi:hypothetical protein